MKNNSSDIQSYVKDLDDWHKEANKKDKNSKLREHVVSENGSF